MQLNRFMCVIAVLAAALTALLFYSVAPEEVKVLHAVGSGVWSLVMYVMLFSIEVTDSRRQVNVRTTNGLCLLAFLVAEVVLCIVSTSTVRYIVVQGLILLAALALNYSLLNKTKE